MFKFPFSNLHELNLDWILEEVKKFSVLIPPMETAVEDVQALQTDVEQAVTDANAAVTAANQASETAAEALEVAEQAASGTIADGAVTTDKLANNAVTTLKIMDKAIVTDKLNIGAVTSEKIADGTIQTRDIADGQITADKLANNAVVEDKLNAGAVTENKIGSGAVTENKIGSGAVTNAKLADHSITPVKLDEDLYTELLGSSLVNASFSTKINASLNFYKRGMFVYASGYLQITTDIPIGEIVVANIPEPIAPAVSFGLVNNTNHACYPLSIGTNGTIVSQAILPAGFYVPIGVIVL